MNEFPILLFWDGEDQLWIADVPDVRYCSAHGPTPEEALHEVRLALADIVADAHERGIALPEPTVRPVLATAHSTVLTADLSKALP